MRPVSLNAGVEAITSFVNIFLYLEPMIFNWLTWFRFLTMFPKTLKFDLSLSSFFFTSFKRFFFASSSLSSTSESGFLFCSRTKYAGMLAWKVFLAIPHLSFSKEMALKFMCSKEFAFRQESQIWKKVRSINPNTLAPKFVSVLNRASYKNSYWLIWWNQALVSFGTNAFFQKQIWSIPYQLLNWWHRFCEFSGHFDLFSDNFFTMSFGILSPIDNRWARSNYSLSCYKL